MLRFIWYYLTILCVLFRALRPYQLAVISQGVAARYARRQASSERAGEYSNLFPRLGHMAKTLIDEGVVATQTKAKL